MSERVIYVLKLPRSLEKERKRPLGSTITCSFEAACTMDEEVGICLYCHSRCWSSHGLEHKADNKYRVRVMSCRINVKRFRLQSLVHPSSLLSFHRLRSVRRALLFTHKAPAIGLWLELEWCMRIRRRIVVRR